MRPHIASLFNLIFSLFEQNHPFVIPQNELRRHLIPQT